MVRVHKYRMRVPDSFLSLILLLTRTYAHSLVRLKACVEIHSIYTRLMSSLLINLGFPKTNLLPKVQKCTQNVLLSWSDQQRLVSSWPLHLKGILFNDRWKSLTVCHDAYIKKCNDELARFTSFLYDMNKWGPDRENGEKAKSIKIEKNPFSRFLLLEFQSFIFHSRKF